MSGTAIQRGVRQSPRKMRLVIDLIRGRNVNEAYALLRYSKKLVQCFLFGEDHVELIHFRLRTFGRSRRLK